MANFTKEKIEAVWQKATIVNGYDSNKWRKDCCGAWINYDQYGHETDYGWEIDHALPCCKNGTDDLTNLRAMHWQNNRCKGDDFPIYTTSVTSDGNKNIKKEGKLIIGQDTITKLRSLYPNNQFLKN